MTELSTHSVTLRLTVPLKLRFWLKTITKQKATLSAIKNPDAMTDYLMAIVGARTNNASLVSSSIKSAIAKDPSMAEKLLTIASSLNTLMLSNNITRYHLV